MKKINRWIGAILTAAMLAAAPVIPVGAVTPAPAATPANREDAESSVQINVTVPLIVAMYAYGQTGAVVVPDSGKYCITNNTKDFELEVTGVRGTNAAMNLTSDIMLQKANELYLQLNNTVVTYETSKVSWIVGEAEDDDGTSLPINVGAKIGSNVNTLGTKKACSVEYTVRPIYTYNQVVFDLNIQGEGGLQERDWTGDYSSKVPEMKWIKKGETFVVPNVELDGYVLQYWVDDLGRPYQIGAVDQPQEDLVLHARWDLDYAGRLHVSSNYLESGASSALNVVEWENGLDIELYNYDSTESTYANGDTTTVAGIPLNYTVTVNNTPISALSGTLTGGRTATEQTIPIHIERGVNGSAWTYGNDITVSVTADNGHGNQRVLTRTLHLNSMEYPTYKVTDNGDGTVSLVLRANDYAGAVTVNYGSALAPDNTNNLLVGWKNDTNGTITVEKNTQYTLLFFKTGSPTVVTTSDFVPASESSPTIQLTR